MSKDLIKKHSESITHNTVGSLISTFIIQGAPSALAFVAASFAYFRGIAWHWAILIGSIVLFLLSVALPRLRAMRRSQQPEPQGELTAIPESEVQERIDALKKSLQSEHENAMAANKRYYESQTEGLNQEIARLREEIGTLQISVKMRDDEFNKYAALHERANEHRQNIHEYVRLEKVFFCYQCLAAPERLRSVFALDIFNKSSFDITIEDVDGFIEFEGTPLNEKPRIINKPVTVSPAGAASITIEQPLTRGDADFIESQNPLFAEFDLENLVITIKGSEPSDGVQSKPLEITRPHRVVRVNQTRKDVKELSARIKLLEEEKAARAEPDITGKIKGVYFEWWANGELSKNSEQMYFDYHFIVNVYVANRGAATTIEQFKVVLKAGEHSYDGEREKDAHDVKEKEMNWREWGAGELDDLEKSNDIPLEHTRNGSLWFVVKGVPNTEDKSEMELELSVIDKDGTSYKLDTFPHSKWEKNPFLHEAQVKEYRARMQRMF